MKRPRPTHRTRLACESLEIRAMLSNALVLGVAGSPPGPTNSVLVRFSSGESSIRKQADLAALRATVVTAHPDGPTLIRLGEGISVSAALGLLRADPGVSYATPNATIHVASAAIGTSDPALGQLWGLSNPNNVDIDEAGALAVTLGTPSTIVAVLDTGIDLNNPDFVGRIWTNPVNDAAAGYPNDIHGWNFINNSPNVQDNDGHGTHVSAVIAANGNNASGVIGVDPSATIMPLKFLDANGDGSTADAISAVYFAVNHGARVINASWGGLDYSAALVDALAYANAHNVVFVTAAGNEGTNNDIVPSYPANFRQPNELSVASVDRFGNLPSFSNYGAGTVDLAAPGVDIISDVPISISRDGLQNLSGTSMSTAYVSGVAALVIGLNPNLTAAQVVHRLDATTRPLASLAGRTISGGMVNAANAVRGLSAASTSPVTIASTPIPGAEADADVHALILASDEFFAAHGSTSTDLVTGLYRNVLDRDPDLAGLQLWVSLEDNGTLGRSQIAADFLGSIEAKLTEVAHWYQDDLGRPSTIAALKFDPGVGAWASLLVGGQGENSVRSSILGSAEFQAAHGSSPVPIVQGYYQNLMGRGADPGGLAYWSGLIAQGTAPIAVVRALQGSAEAQQTKVARWFLKDLKRPGTLERVKSDLGVQGLASLLGNG